MGKQNIHKCYQIDEEEINNSMGILPFFPTKESGSNVFFSMKNTSSWKTPPFWRGKNPLQKSIWICQRIKKTLPPLHSHYNESNIWKWPSSHQGPSPLFTTFRLHPGNLDSCNGITFWKEAKSNFICFSGSNDNPFLFTSFSLHLPRRLWWSLRDHCFSGQHYQI